MSTEFSCLGSGEGWAVFRKAGLSLRRCLAKAASSNGVLPNCDFEEHGILRRGAGHSSPAADLQARSSAQFPPSPIQPTSPARTTLCSAPDASSPSFLHSPLGKLPHIPLCGGKPSLGRGVSIGNKTQPWPGLRSELCCFSELPDPFRASVASF